MMKSRRHFWPALIIVLSVATSANAQTKVDMTLTDKDRAEILALSAAYGPALLGCQPEKYADLFATPGGYFGSSARGEVRDRQSLIEMVLSYDRCDSKPADSASIQPAAGAGRGNRFPEPVIEQSPEGAKARIINSRGGGYYDDVYVRTPKGWKFKSRNVVSDAEVAAKLTTEDFIEIRQLAGDDHGYYENLYGEYQKKIGPRTSSSDKLPFRTSGLKLTPEADGSVHGIAYLRDNGGHYEDTYVKTPQGWRIKERLYFPPESTGSTK
jgi:hypothetical protein